jgi:lipopolysaccharide/colanic/teichoic acid biosynthesis glycosyltransferase
MPDTDATGEPSVSDPPEGVTSESRDADDGVTTSFEDPSRALAPLPGRERAAAHELLEAEDHTPLLGRLNAYGFRLVMLADLLVLVAITLGTMVVRFGWQWPTYPRSLYLVSFAIALGIFMASLYFGGLYEREPRLGAPPALPRVARQTMAAGGLVALLTLVVTGMAREIGLLASATGVTPELGLPVARALPFPILNLMVLIGLGAAGVATNRWLAHVLRTRREGPPKVLLAGGPSDVKVARKHLAMETERAAVVGEAHEAAELLELVAETGATDVVLVSSSWVDELYPSKLEALERAGITVLLRVGALETMFGLERVREVAGLPFVLLRSQTIAVSRARFKRFFDLLVLAAAAPVAVVLVGAVGIYQLVVAGRPVLFWQERVGAGGRRFQMVKFRTMVIDAEADGEGARLAEEDDPRIIPACRWIRATRLDELPQLWNVLRGEMSLVGPRPERPELTAAFEREIPGYARRYELPPGLTGLAQIHGRYHTDPEYKLGYDLQYLVNWSPVLDLEILARTVWVVLARRL